MYIEHGRSPFGAQLDGRGYSMQKFTDDDLEKFKVFVNKVVQGMVFKGEQSYETALEHHKDLVFIQKRLIPLMEANILEVLPNQSETRGEREARTEK